MRDPSRIPIILERLRLVWEKNPDLRLGQLIQNLEKSFFYLEDDDFLDDLEQFYEKISKKEYTCIMDK